MSVRLQRKGAGHYVTRDGRFRIVRNRLRSGDTWTVATTTDDDKPFRRVSLRGRHEVRSASLVLYTLTDCRGAIANVYDREMRSDAS